MVEQIIRAGRLDRAFYTQLIFDGYATGNAVLVVALVYGLHGLLRFRSLDLLLNVLLRGAIAWVLMALVIWLVGTKLLEGDAQAQTVIRLTGFAHVPLLAWLLDLVISPLGFWLGVVWLAAAVLVATEVVLGADRRTSLISAGAGLLVWAVLVAF